MTGTTLRLNDAIVMFVGCAAAFWKQVSENTVYGRQQLQFTYKLGHNLVAQSGRLDVSMRYCVENMWTGGSTVPLSP